MPKSTASSSWLVAVRLVRPTVAWRAAVKVPRPMRPEVAA